MKKKDPEPHEMDQSLNDEDYVASYWTWINSHTEDELIKTNLKLTPASLRRMEQIAAKNVAPYCKECKRPLP